MIRFLSFIYGDVNVLSSDGYIQFPENGKYYWLLSLLSCIMWLHYLHKSVLFEIQGIPPGISLFC